MKPVGSPTVQIASWRNFPYIYLLFGVAICFAVYEIILGGVDADEVESFHTAWKIFIGESIYRDFFQHHHPLFYYLLIPVVAIGGETVFTFHLAELFSAVLWAGIVVTTYKLAGKIYGDRRIALFSMVLLLVFPWFIMRGTHVRPDIPQVLLGLLSFYYLMLALDGWPEGKTRRHLLLSALLLSLSFLALQKAVFLIFVQGLILLHRLFARGGVRITLRDFLLYWTFFSLLPVLCVIYLFMAGYFWSYFDFNWLINLKLIENFSVIDLLRRDTNVLLSMAGFTVLFIAGCFVKPPGNGSAHWAAVLAGTCLMASLFFVKIPHPQYFLMAVPFVAIVAAASLRHFLPRAATGLILSALLYLCCNHLIESTGNGGAKKGTISAMKYVLEVSEPEDVYFGYRTRNLLRKNTDFFWFCFTPGKCLDTLRGFREYDWDPVQIIVQTRPKVIGVRPGWEGWYAPIIKHPMIAPHYERSPKHPSLYTRKEASPE